ncbi:N-carbamoylputrescine amidase [Clostridium sp. E02]|uniref:N-carbamoylputrescine amidase n=1 Tax=Clostridium sp. E02 TaxID=2487134 RepID=UPI000F5294DF|nr:N-carbamoylputrescine amidase [Clostridium sp. E02]
MRMVTAAAVQMKCCKEIDKNIENAERLVRQAAAEGAHVILLPELFERSYFCQERRYEFYDYAKTVEENDAIVHFMKIAKELSVVLPISFYEKSGEVLFNSVAVLDADGTNLGVYRKTHIPDDHYYQEKFYFTPGDTGFRVFKTQYGTIGIGICWDQWFPETARCLTLSGAELILYPTAIGSEPILNCDSMEHWRRCMMGHSASNIVPIIASNRVGEELVVPCKENGNQSSSLRFYGSSFLTDCTGALLGSLGRVEEGVVCASFDLDEIKAERTNWGLFRDRRPDQYKMISGGERNIHNFS